MRPSLRLPLIVVGLVVFALAVSAPSRADHIAGTSCGSTVSCAGHEYWPRMTLDDVQKAREYRGTTLRGKPGNDDELLGWHGSDTLYGGAGADVIWADHVGTGQPTTQWDHIWGGPGGDFVYSAKGRNTIRSEGGNDAVKIRYGHGFLDCGSGIDTVYVPRSRKSKWTIRNCERYEYRTEAARGHGIKRVGD